MNHNVLLRLSRSTSTQFSVAKPSAMSSLVVLVIINLAQALLPPVASAQIVQATPARPGHRAKTAPTAGTAVAPAVTVAPAAPMATATVVPNFSPNEVRRRRPPAVLPAVSFEALPQNPRHEFSLLGGLSLSGNGDIDSTAYQHKPLDSPVLKIGYQFSFPNHRSFNLLIGGELIYLHAEEVASSSLATATFVSNFVDGGPTIGLSWSPDGAGSAFQIQAKFGIGLPFSRSTQLRSAGYTTTIANRQTRSNLGPIWPGVAIWEDILACYQATPNWRLSGGLLQLESTYSLIAGAAYVF